MDDKISGFINGIKDDSFSLLRDQFGSFVDGLKNEKDDFSKKQHAKLENFLLQLAAKPPQITKQQFVDAMNDMKALADMEVTLAKVQAKASAQRLSEGLQKLVINGLIKAIPG
jgi:hypothetical protein